jgi:hypothetical protein
MITAAAITAAAPMITATMTTTTMTTATTAAMAAAAMLPALRRLGHPAKAKRQGEKHDKGATHPTRR